MKIQITLTLKNGKIKTYRKASKRRFRYLCSLGLWKTLALYVEYGKDKDVYGKTVLFTNEGIYTDGKEAMQAYIAFTE